MPSYLDPISIDNVPRIDKVCKTCGNDDVYIVGVALWWSKTSQRWVYPADYEDLHPEYSDEEAMQFCDSCGTTTTIIDKEV
tara:strand:+ start:714 stop:956 length:243 start_codon:yes stop_codon:yes gene_type:complete